MRYAGYATAAAVVAATLVGVLGLGSSSAAARVQKALDNAAKAKSVKVTAMLINVETEGKMTHVQTMFRQGDVVRIETVWAPPQLPDKPVTVADLKTRKSLILLPQLKTAQRGTLGVEESQGVAGLMGNFAELKAQLTGGDDKAVKAVGEERIGGRRTKAYEITVKDSKVARPGVWTVWVDPETELPVRLAEANGGLILNFDDWNKEFDPKLFSLEVPAGYKLEAGPSVPVSPVVTLLRQAAEKAATSKSYRYVALYISLDDPTALPRRVTNLYRGPLQRMEALDQSTVMVCDWAGKRVLELDTAAKTAHLEAVTDAEAADARRGIADVARLLTDQFKGNPDYELKERPREVVNGRPVRVLEARRKPGAKPGGPNDSVAEVFVVWIDVETGFPVRTRAQTQDPAGRVEKIGLFDQWNEEFDPKLFALDVPAGYKLIENDKED
jgi:outer membrane lipoprotein-sorting protein